MSKIQDIALSYDRFSNPIQGEGDSEDRQQRAYTSFIQRHQLLPSKEYTFIDRGLSGYDGTHKDKGDLGRLLEIAKTGVFKPRRGQPGYVLVVEAWDRLGQLRPDRMIDLIRDLLAYGLKIGVCRLDDIFEEKDFGSHKWIVLSTFVHLAHQESKQKSERIKNSYQARVARAREDGALTGNNLPAWLECVNGEQREIPECAAANKRIFELAKIGRSTVGIVKTLTEEKVPPFGEYKVNKGHKRSQYAGDWTRSYVHLILHDRRVIGEYQPTKTDDEGNRRNWRFPRRQCQARSVRHCCERQI
jgi:DNA invertase Pin-like site-specific DNA recombinase